MSNSEIVIVGGGILGLTLARELLGRGRDVLVLEKEGGLGVHASGRNSGVLHAGIYYAPDSRKASTCLRGNRLMKRYCREKGLPLEESGKVIVASGEAELDVLDELHRRALACGADVAAIDEAELAELEPHAVTTDRALHSRETAVVSPKAILHSLAGDIQAMGGRIRHGARVADRRGDTGLRLADGELVGFDLLINCAGAFAEKLAHLFGAGREYRVLPFKGTYRKLRSGREKFCRSSIYPVPDIRNPFLGVHFTRSVDGDVYLGPTALPCLTREAGGSPGAEAVSILAREARLFAVNPRFRAVALAEPRKYLTRFFLRDAQKLVPSLRPEDVEPSAKFGIRPQLVDTRTNELVMDFVMEEAETSLHVLNAISPAFTSSMATARDIADRLESIAA
ncbi:L-2-hydroxyglutarate oxidase [Desulfohalovibrio reitneri]|uniref:L-2-hydroxyglutarate oxidase n=1 Tax=Desulfohalovibrio reitneri TaxID=1307759 RepID=UPI0004A70599|nr:L-2-hydroxyglutarate oxidase [Desulfohalovibrio reitneri]